MQLTIETVTRTRTVRDVIVRRNIAATVDGAPFRISKRTIYAYAVGLQFVRALGHSSAEDMPYIAIVDGQRRILAAWRAMDGLPGYTGTNDSHPLISDRGMFYRR